MENDPDTLEESKEINMEVGIEDYLNIKMHFPSNTYQLSNVIHGKVLFSQIKLLIKKMDLNIIRKEILGSGVNSTVETSEVNSFEIMDGCPIKGSFEITRRRGNPYSDVSGGNQEFDAHNEQNQQQVFGEVLPQFDHDRRSRKKILQTKRNHFVPVAKN